MIRNSCVLCSPIPNAASKTTGYKMGTRHSSCCPALCDTLVQNRWFRKHTREQHHQNRVGSACGCESIRFCCPKLFLVLFAKGTDSVIYIYARALRVHAACTTHRLHMKKSHIKLRSACLNQLNALFHTITGRNLPIQKYIVDVTPASINSNVLALKIKKYTVFVKSVFVAALFALVG